MIHSLHDAIVYFQDIFSAHPERNGMAAYAAAMAGQRRKYPALAIDHLVTPDDKFEPTGELELPSVTMPEGPETELARTIINMLTPLKMLNPVCPVFSLGRGPGTLAASFGAELDPEAGYQVTQTRSISEVLALPPPDVETAGLLPEMRERIALIKRLTPDMFKIAIPDMQGPFNIAHALVGEEALTGPYIEPEKFHALMSRITDYWIAVRQLLEKWTGEDRCDPRSYPPRIAECSVNLVSPDFYLQHILPYDRRIATAFGQVAIHPCSGPHVFKVTLDNLPVARSEAGYVAKATAGAITVKEAMQLIAGRPIGLLIGQEPPEGREYEFILSDLDCYEQTPRLMFSYTGMHWRRKDRPFIRELHRRLDEYWTGKFGAGGIS